MTRVDLDALDIAAGYCPDHAKELIWDAITELRAAREVVEAARRHECGTAYQDSVWALIVAYDEVVTS